MTLKLSQLSSTRMDVELVKFINADMTWNVMRKGRTSITRRPRKPGAGSFQFVYNVHEPTESKKVIDGSSKKRRISHQSTSPPSKTPCIKGEEGLSRGPQTPSVCREDSAQRCRSGSLTKSRKTKFASRLKSGKTKKTKKGGLNPNDFSGIALLADVACSIFVHEVSKEHTAPEVKLVNTCGVDIGTEDEEKKDVSSKELRLHWDLNTVMDDWEDPRDDLGLIGAKTATVKTSDGENSASKSEMVDLLTHSPTSVLKEQLDPRKVTTDDRVIEGCGSNVTQENKIDVDYDSPFEDGELREPIGKPEEETVNESGIIYTDELVEHGHTVGNPHSLLVKEVGPDNEIKHGVRPHTDEPQKDNFERKKLCMDESTSFDVCRNGDYLHRSRSSNIGDSTIREYDLKSHRSLDRNYTKNYNSRGGGYRTQDRRPSPPERNNSYGSYRGPSHSRDRYRYHSQEYHDPKPHFTPNFNRPGAQPRSRSGSPIAWNFQKRKNVSPERSAKCFDDHRRFNDGQVRDKRQASTGYEKLKPDDYYRFNQRSARFSMNSYKYKENNDDFRKHDGYYEKVNRVGRDDGARRFRYGHNRE